MALVHRPTYQLYSVAARNLGAEVVGIEPRTGIEPDWDAFLAAAPRCARRLHLLAEQPDRTRGERRARCAPSARACPGIVLCDQAYLELGGIDHLPLVAEHDNLIIGRTFSKGFGLGAARVGYAHRAARADRSARLAAPARLALVVVGGGRRDRVRAGGRDARARRAHASPSATASPRACAPRASSVDAVAGNYVLARLPTPDTFERLAERGLVVRTFAHEPLLAGHFRATVSNPDANDRLVAALAELAGREPPAGRSPRATGRRAEVHRATKETRIDCALALDGAGRARVATGLGFLDHLLTALAFWWMVDLDLRCSGDLWIDEHHTLEDCAIALGEALDARARRPRRADALRRCARAARRGARRGDGRPLRPRASPASSSACSDERVGQVPTSLLPHFLDTFARRGRIGLHVRVEGEDDHHRAEAAFKALALALRSACAPDPARTGISSTKGLL